MKNSALESPTKWQIFCGVVWDENDARTLAARAAERGYEILWETLHITHSGPVTEKPSRVFVFFEGGMDQSDPLALEFSDPVGRIAVISRDDASRIISQSSEWDWEDCWEMAVPWISPYALSNFPEATYDDFLGPPSSDEEKGYFTT